MASNATDSDEEFLASSHQGVSILALRMSSRRRLGMYLNQEAIPLPSGLLPNYQGLAELIGFEFIEQLSFQRDRDPTMALLMEWGNRTELQPSLGNLVKYLVELERSDVLTDCKQIIEQDAAHFLKKKAAASSDINPVQDSTVSQSPFTVDDMEVDETAIMTVQDVEMGRPTYYDAFVCYHPEGDDLGFVKLMIDKVEAAPYNLKLFVPHRDDLPGASKYVISAKLIQDRCKRMVIVMSPKYLQSDACDFQTKFAHALSPGSRSKKLVPVLVTYCEIPNILRHVTTCDYTRGDLTGWFWDRLIKSLQAPLNAHEVTVNTDLSNLEMNIESQGAVSLSSPPTHTHTHAASQPLAVRSPTSDGGRGAQSLAGSSSSLDSTRSDKSGSKKKTACSPLSSSPALSTPPASPSAERKSGAKKKSLKSKLTSVFSSHSSC